LIEMRWQDLKCVVEPTVDPDEVAARKRVLYFG